MADRPDVSFKVLGFSLALSLLLSLLPGEWEVAGAVTCGTGGGTGTGIGTRELCVNSASDAVDAKPGDGVCATAAGTCTLRAAIMEANALPGAQTIVLLAGTYTLTIPPDATPDDGADGDLDITANLAIIGAGAESTIVQACTTNQKTARCPTGQGIADRVFQVLSGATVDIAGVTIRNGKGLSEGGGILNGGVLSITKSIVSSNTAGTGELSGNGGGILNNGTLAIQDSIVSSNLSGVYGGGIYNLSGSFTMTGSTLRDNIGGYGGAIRSESSTTTISSSTISDNTASFASGGGILSVYGTLTVTGSTISDNNALMAAGGGGILTSSTTIIINSTISGNRASDFGGGGIHSLSPVTVISSTVVGNSATDSKGGGGLRNFYAHNPFVLRNSIVANSPKGGNCAGVITSEGYNLSSDATCGLAGTGDLQNTDPKLGPLADNGGPTQTHALMTGGPAIDAVPVATCTDPSGNPLVADQRGGPRPIDGDGDGVAACDIGAFELMVAPILLSPADGARLTTIGTLLSWQNPPGTTQAHIQVISSDTGAAVIDQTLRFPATSFIVPEPGVILSNLSYNYILLPDTAYTWRVQTLNLSNQSWGPWAQRTFRTRTTSSATISPVSPPDGGAVSTATPTLTWANSDSSIFLYEVQLSEDPTFTLAESACSFVYWNVIHGGITKPLNSFTVPASHPLSNRTNYWRVRPRIQGDGTPLPWSRTFSFTVTAPSAPGAATPTPTPIASAAAVPPAPLPAIAYVSVQNGNWEVYLMNPDGGGQVRLTNEPATDGDLTWSPDGTKLAFTSNRTGVYQIYTMNRDGTEVTPLTASTALNGDPVWSLGGGIIAFAACRDGNSEIYVMRNPHGTEQTRITRNTAFDGDPTQSPDGSRIAFVSQRDGIFEIYAMNADGSGLTRLTTSVPGVSNGDPSWSPDGTRIAFTSDRTGNWEIYTMRPGGSDVRQLTNNKAVDGDPAWSPDSQRIIFFSDRDGNKEIYVMNADGSGQTRLTFNTWDDFEPVWWGPELSAVVARMAPGGGGGGAPPSPPPSPLPPPPLPITGGAAPAAGQVAGPATALASASFAPGTGGALRSGDYSISVPAGVTGQAGVVAVQVAPITGEVPAPAAGTVLAGQAFELGLSVAGQWVPDQLQRPLQISFPLDPASLAAAGGLPQNFALAFLDEATGRWQILPTICSAQACTAEVHHLSTFALLVTIPTPTATYPGDATTVYYLGPRLAWQTEGNVTQYHVQLAPTGFDGPAIDLIVSDPAAGAAAYFDVPAPVMGSGPYIMLPGTTYAWRVRTSTFGGTLPADSPGWSRWSAARTFSTNQPVGWGISAVAPRTGGLADSATPTLRWTDQFAFYFFYELQMSQDPRFGPDSFLYWEQRHGGMTEPLNSYSVPPEFPLTPNTTYYWRVRPWVPPASPASGWSETFSLRTPG